MQSVGQSVEECPSGAYCYNMTASAAFVVDMVKAGCSTWRCMLARDKCISMTFQMVPVSLCCCSYDRCNVGENPSYDQLPSSGGSSSIGWGGNGGSSDVNDNEQINRRKWGGLFAQSSGSSSTHSPSGAKDRLRQKQFEDRFKEFDVDRRDSNNDGEELFERVDVRFTTPSPRGRRPPNSPTSQSSLGREIELDD
ncbi:hypothetical protein DICVIV_09514 [Dictyocaulus viviparus]|uniref:Uncharacterized protein n=1 Tax=Dictyocaulus viviparus TaxID=29172 RepID=A0A0D8XIH5_DICVI|nr:hypothetical protein DICVIV_09514 [Dictyocaulus viviparus]